MGNFTESVVEDAALAWLESLGYAVKHGPDISPGGGALTLALSQC
jgi:type I restriction enzyme R subunit